MVSVVFSALVAGRIFPQSIYTIKLFKRGIDINHGKYVNVLRSHTVREIMDEEFETIPAWTNLHDIFMTLEHSKESCFVINDRNDNLKGMISFQDIRNLLSHHELDYLVIAQDLVPPETVVIKDTDTLEEAHNRFAVSDFRLIPVVSNTEPSQVIGVVRKEELVDYYNKRLLESLRA